MGVYEELVARGLIAQVTDEEEIKELEAKKKLADAENEKRMAEMQKSLDQMSGYEKEEK